MKFPKFSQFLCPKIVKFFSTEKNQLDAPEMRLGFRLKTIEKAR
jgi:hypothetical protein